MFVGENADVEMTMFIWISKGGGSVTQSIEVTESDSKSTNMGYSFINKHSD